MRALDDDGVRPGLRSEQVVQDNELAILKALAAAFPPNGEALPPVRTADVLSELGEW